MGFKIKMKKEKNYIISSYNSITHKGKKVDSVGFNTEEQALDFIYNRKLTKPIVYIKKGIKATSPNYKIKTNSVGQIISIKKSK